MNKRVIIISLLLVFALMLMAGPIFSPMEKEYDFGEIFEKDGKVTHKFKFTNTGDEALSIIDVHAS